MATSTDDAHTFRTTIRPERQTLSAVTIGPTGTLVVAGLSGIGTHALAAP